MAQLHGSLVYPFFNAFSPVSSVKALILGSCCLFIPSDSRFPGRHGQVPKGNETQGHVIVLSAGERRENQGHDDMLCVSVFSLFEVKQCHQEELPKSDEEIRVTAAGSVSVRFREGEQIGTGDMQSCRRLAFGQDWPLVV